MKISKLALSVAATLAFSVPAFAQTSGSGTGTGATGTSTGTGTGTDRSAPSAYDSTTTGDSTQAIPNQNRPRSGRNSTTGNSMDSQNLPGRTGTTGNQLPTDRTTTPPPATGTTGTTGTGQ